MKPISIFSTTLPSSPLYRTKSNSPPSRMIRSANLRPTLLKTPLSQTLTGAKRLASHNAPSWNQPSGYLFGERVCRFLSPHDDA